jgi:hypothetical protein
LNVDFVLIIVSSKKDTNERLDHPLKNFKKLLDLVEKSSIPYFFYKKVLKFKNIKQMKEYRELVNRVLKENDKSKKNFEKESENMQLENGRFSLFLKFLSKLNIKHFIFIEDVLVGNSDFLETKEEGNRINIENKSEESKKFEVVVESCKKEDLSEILYRLDNENSILNNPDISDSSYNKKIDKKRRSITNNFSPRNSISKFPIKDQNKHEITPIHSDERDNSEDQADHQNIIIEDRRRITRKFGTQIHENMGIPISNKNENRKESVDELKPLESKKGINFS